VATRRPEPGVRPHPSARPYPPPHSEPRSRPDPRAHPEPQPRPEPLPRLGSEIRPESGVRPKARPSARRTALAAATVGSLTLVIRLALHGQSFDLFGDEVIYTQLGRSVINGGFPSFEGPFFLHGPAFFYLEAGWARLLGSPHDLMGWIYEMRTLNALIAGATAAVLVVLATRVGSLWSGTAAGLLFALDPFCIRQNDRVLLETALMLWVMLGYLLITTLIDRPVSRGAMVRAVLAGVFFGFAVLTKDEGALLSIPPLLAAAALRWGPDRRLILVTIFTIVDVYVAYLTVVVANRFFHIFWVAKTAGIVRMLGVIQTTGFHSSAGGGSLTSRLFAEANFFGTTYILLALAVVAALIALRRGGNQQRMLGLLYIAAGLTLAYAVFLGTLEEQELYLLIVPSILIIPVAATLVCPARPSRRQPARGANRGIARAAVLASALVLVLSINLGTSIQWLREPDDGFARLIQYMGAHVPAGTAVAAITGDIETPYSLGADYNVGYWDTPAALSREHVRYIVVEWASVDEGYSTKTPAEVRQLVAHGKVVFSFRGRTYGNLELYQLPLPMNIRNPG
jgi:hypothetical protein